MIHARSDGPDEADAGPRKQFLTDRRHGANHECVHAPQSRGRELRRRDSQYLSGTVEAVHAELNVLIDRDPQDGLSL